MKSQIKLNYLLPNLFTAASIFVAVISIIHSAKAEFENAAWLIVLSLILDSLDGKIARLTHGESKFGVEFDSLADIVAFGVAPAILLYFSIGIKYGKLGILISALYVVFGAIRLARFNITTQNIDSSVFIGLPIPAAALSLISITLLELKYKIYFFEIFILFIALLISILMVSNIRYFSLKKISFKKSISLKVLIISIFILSAIYLYPIETLNIIFFIYILLGILRAIWAINKFKKI